MYYLQKPCQKYSQPITHGIHFLHSRISMKSNCFEYKTAPQTQDYQLLLHLLFSFKISNLVTHTHTQAASSETELNKNCNSEIQWLTSRVAKDSLSIEMSSWREPMKSNDSSRLKANGMSTKTLRNRSAGPSWERLPLNNLSFNSSSAVGAIFNNVWSSSTGSSFPAWTKMG